MVVPTYDELRAYRELIQAPWFTLPWDLNLFIARSGKVGQWDDLVLFAFVDDGGRDVVEAYIATGDAWQGEWLNPSHPGGCIYVLNQHVPGGLELGTFNGRPALRQQKPFRCVRWPPDGTIPMVAALDLRPSFVANRGTHVHNRVSGRAPEKPVTDDSEGCTVLLYQHQHAAMIRLVQEQRVWHCSSIVSPTYCARIRL